MSEIDSYSNVLVRQAMSDDAGLLAELGARTFWETFAPDNSPENMRSYLASAFGREQQAAELADPDSIFQIAENQGVALGYSLIRAGEIEPGITGTKPIELVRLYVLRENLGKGIGAALMRASIDQAQQRGYQTLWLGVWEHNARAKAFYLQWDFRAVGTHVFQLGDDPQTDILMERSIL